MDLELFFDKSPERIIQPIVGHFSGRMLAAGHQPELIDATFRHLFRKGIPLGAEHQGIVG